MPVYFPMKSITQSNQRFLLPIIIVAAISSILFFLIKDLKSKETDYNEWKVSAGSKESIKYSTLSEIDTNNVKNLEIAWIYQSEQGDSSKFGPMQTNPIIVQDILYAVSPKMKLFALNAATGKEIWVFDPRDSLKSERWHRKSENMNRGVAYWEKDEDRRIIFTVGPVVFSIDASTGALIKSFGEAGGIDLRNGLDREVQKSNMTPTSPVMVFKDYFIVSGQVDEGTPGHIRAFDVRTGEQKWIFHTIPYPGEYGYDTWEDSTAYKTKGSTNAWSGFSLDEDRGILFAGIGNPTNDFYGGDRWGMGYLGTVF